MGDQSRDKFLPTLDEKDALQGTDGRPSRFNKYVTEEDPRLGAGARIYCGQGAPP
jgi:hypothetical protein